MDEHHRRGRSVARWEIPIYSVVNDRVDRVDGHNEWQQIRRRLGHLRHQVPAWSRYKIEQLSVEDTRTRRLATT
jgi:hypothetical protein